MSPPHGEKRDPGQELSFCASQETHFAYALEFFGIDRLQNRELVRRRQMVLRTSSQGAGHDASAGEPSRCDGMQLQEGSRGELDRIYGLGVSPAGISSARLFTAEVQVRVLI